MHDIHAIPWCGLREPFSALSHWVGAGVFAGFAIQLWNRSGPQWDRKIPVGVLIVTTLQTLSVSGCYHLFGHGPWREFFLRADVASIFFMVAGSFTPVHAILLRGRWRWPPLVAAWTVAVLGAAYHMTMHAGLPGQLGIIILMLFGWCSVATVVKMWSMRGLAFVATPIVTGLTYTVGACLLLLKQPMLIRGLIGPHEVWHLAVLLALGLHWTFVFRIASETETEHATILKFPAATEAPALPQRRAA